MKLCVLDPGIGEHDGRPSSNLGDLIIQEAVSREMYRLFEPVEILRYSTHQPLDRLQLKSIGECVLTLVGGTNLLSSNMFDLQFNNPRGQPLLYRQWKVSTTDVFSLRNVLLLGVGWWQYQRPPGMITKWYLTSILAKERIHSVRDSYTANMLRGMGVTNVVNTGCPTMWPLGHMDQSAIPESKAENVLVMLTDYNKCFVTDKRLIELLQSKYRKVYLWPQGRRDAEYITQLGVSVELLDHTFDSFTHFVGSQLEFDYIGTRLHGGVYCLLHRRRSLILKIDNRATEIAKDTGLPTAERSDFEAITRWIDGRASTNIRMPVNDIRNWREQFQAEKSRGNENAIDLAGAPPRN